jgi:hypothetical protein
MYSKAQKTFVSAQSTAGFLELKIVKRLLSTVVKCQKWRFFTLLLVDTVDFTHTQLSISHLDPLLNGVVKKSVTGYSHKKVA